MESVSLYSEARNEYIKQLATWVVPQFVEFFRKEYDRIAATDGKKVMASFQTWCSEVPRWNQDVIDTHVNDLLDNCRCDYIEDLMTAVFIAHTKMLTAIRVGGRQKKLQITLPKLDHFLHRVFVECARAFWKAPFLFSDEVSMIDRQKNVLQAEAMCVEALSGAVRSLLPIKNILRDNLVEDEEEEVEKPKKHKKKKYDSSSSDSSSSEDEKPVKKKAPVAPVAPEVMPDVQDEQVGGELEIDEIDPTPVFTAPVSPAISTIPTTPIPIIEEQIPLQEIPPTLPTPIVNEPSKPPSILKPVSVTKEPSPVQLIKEEQQQQQEQVVIDTEPTVKFSPYEMVFDESKPEISEMRYAPKMSIEEMPDKPEYEPVYYEDDEDRPLPKIQFGSGEVGLSGSDMEIVGDSVETAEMEDEIGLSDADFETI